MINIWSPSVTSVCWTGLGCWGPIRVPIWHIEAYHPDLQSSTPLGSGYTFTQMWLNGAEPKPLDRCLWHFKLWLWHGHSTRCFHLPIPNTRCRTWCVTASILRSQLAFRIQNRAPSKLHPHPHPPSLNIDKNIQRDSWQNLDSNATTRVYRVWQHTVQWLHSGTGVAEADMQHATTRERESSRWANNRKIWWKILALSCYYKRSYILEEIQDE
jgi:hypothetical protein